MDKAAVIARIEEGRRAFEDVLLAQSEETLTREGTLQDWALKDIVAHLTFWQRLVSARLAPMLGETHAFAKYLDTGQSVQQLNDEYFDVASRQSAGDVLLESKQAYDELITLARRLPEEWLPRTDLAWTDGDALWDHITNDGSAHFFEHLEQIRQLDQEAS